MTPKAIDKPAIDMLGRAPLATLAEAVSMMLSRIPACRLDFEEIPPDEASGRVTARDIISPEDIPPHPRATMDGYAVRARDTFGAMESLPSYFEIAGEVAMGEKPDRPVAAGICHKIATGGFMPPGADAVVMLEHTVEADRRMIEVTQPVAAGGNVIQAGEDTRRGDVLVPAGHRLRPADIGLLAGVGIVSAPVRRRARIGIISTGDEIVPHTETPPPGKMRDINGLNIAALARLSGAEPRFHGIAPDDETALRAILERAISESDLVVLSGGSSVGSRDAAARVIDSFGPPGIIVHGIAMKPGKPVIIAFAGYKPVFGLPGHPAAVSVAFNAVVCPAIDKISGFADVRLPRILHARLARSVNSAAGRRDFIRMKVERMDEPPGFSAIPLLGKSGAISTIARAGGYVVIAEDRQGIAEGETVEVEIFD